jgi:hypothetical protein
MVGPFIPFNQIANSALAFTPILALRNQDAWEPNSYQKMFASRHLDQRSRISFHYPGANADGDETIVFLPFYENPTITETQAANYGEYNIIGRGSSLYSYLGSGSRKLKVSMYFTLPHLAMHEMGIDRFMRVFKGAGKESEKGLFTYKTQPNNKAGKGDVNNSLALSVEKEYYSLIGAANDNVLPGNLKDAGSQTQDILQGTEPNEMTKIIDTLLFFISLLRTSVVNKASNPMYGPPLLRLSFGTLYQSVPCIAKSYNLSWEEDAGYHLESLTPRRLKVDITMEEIRVGDFGNYEPAKYQVRDNLTGWESAIDSPHTTDPLPQAGYWGGSK